MEKVWEIKDPDALLNSMKTKRISRQAQPVPEKDPAKAYSLSMLCWGGGHFYNKQFAKGAAFLAMMLVVIAGAILTAIYRTQLPGALRWLGISTEAAFLGAEILLFCALLFWIYNASDAYHVCARSRTTRFTGVTGRAAPTLASLFFPGWGQYLNGQPIKGGIHAALAALGFFSLASSAATLLAWPALGASDTRFVLESIFAIALCATPFVPLLWALSVHDAFKVSDDEITKEPVWERIKAAYFRCRTQGLVRGVVPHIKQTLLLALLLALFTIVVPYTFPRDFYIEQLTRVRSYLLTLGMTIVPEFLSRILELLNL